MAAPLVEFRDVAFAWPHRDAHGEERPASPALAGVTFALPAGRLCAVAGRNGAGKSTLALCVNGTVPHLVRGAFAGEVLVAGRPAGPPRDRAHEVGVVFQDFEAHLVSSSAEHEVAFPLEHAGLLPDAQRARVGAALALTGLDGFADRVSAELSGGEKQRLAIAAAAALEPPVLVLDEPLTDLDPEGKTRVLEVVARLRARGHAILLVEHDPAALLAADRLLVLDAGKVAFFGTPREVFADPARTAALGLPEWAPAQVAVALGVTVSDVGIEAVATLLRAGPVRGTVSNRKGEPSTVLDGPPATRAVAPFIEFEDVTSGYPGGPDVLHGITLVVREGECVALLGQNGSGKTALAKHAVGLIRPRRGAVRVAGRPVGAWEGAELSRLAGYVFQNPDHQIFADSVHEEVAFGARHLGLAAGEIEERIAAALAAVGLEGREAEDPFSLTRGERQRLAVASLLAYRPRCIVFDEPTTGLDAAQARSMMDFIRGLHRAGTTVVLITHAMWAAAEYADRVAVVARGRIALDGPAGEVFAAEAELARLALAPPPAAALANRLGVPARSTAGLLAALRDPGRGAG